MANRFERRLATLMGRMNAPIGLNKHHTVSKRKYKSRQTKEWESNHKRNLSTPTSKKMDWKTHRFYDIGEGSNRPTIQLDTIKFNIPDEIVVERLD